MSNSTKRALRTFLQSFIGYVAANVMCIIAGVDITTKEGLKVLLINLLIPAVATAIAKAMNKDEDGEIIQELEGEDNEDMS